MLTLSQEVIDELFPLINPNLSVISANDGMNNLMDKEKHKKSILKLVNIKFKNKRHIKQIIEQERLKLKIERDRIDEKRKYWQD